MAALRMDNCPTEFNSASRWVLDRLIASRCPKPSSCQPVAVCFKVSCAPSTERSCTQRRPGINPNGSSSISAFSRFNPPYGLVLFSAPIVKVRTFSLGRSCQSDCASLIFTSARNQALRFFSTTSGCAASQGRANLAKEITSAQLTIPRAMMRTRKRRSLPRTLAPDFTAVRRRIAQAGTALRL